MSRVLIVDADAASSVRMHGLLTEAGLLAKVCGTLPAALQLLASWRPDMLLLDAGLADAGGPVEAAHRLRSVPGLDGVGLLLLCPATDLPQQATPDVAEWADGCIARPGSDAAFLSCLLAFLRLQDAQSLLRRSEARQRQLFETSVDGLLVVGSDKANSIVAANPAAGRLLGRPHDKLAGELFGHELVDGRVFTWALSEVGGRQRVLEVRTTALEWAGQDAWLAALRDVTAARESERRLRASEQRYRSLIENHPDAAYALDGDGRITAINAAFERLTGWSLAELQGEGRALALVPASRELARQQLALALAGRTVQYEAQVQHREGLAIWVEVTHLPIVIDGEVEGVYGVAHDVSRRRAAEEALRRTQALLDIAGRNARVGGWSVEVPSMEVSWSDVVACIHEEPPGFVPPLADALAYYPPEDRERLQLVFGRCVSDGLPFDLELQIVTAQGARRWVRSIGEAVRDAQGQIVRVQGAFQDIDARKAAEHSTRELAQRLNSTLESITDSFFTLDKDWRFTHLNRQAERVLQRDRGSLLGRVVWDEFPAAIGSDFERHYRHAMQTLEPVEFQAHYGPLALWVEARAYPSDQGLAVFFRDITVQRREAERLRLLEACIERSNDIVMITEAEPIDDPGPRTVYVNAAFERRTGYTQAEALGNSPRMLQGPRTDRAALDRIRAALRAWQPVREELVNYRKDGSEFWLELDIAPVADETGWFTHWVAVERDITERKQAERAVEESLARFRLLSQAAMDAIWDWNLDTRELWWNDGYQRLFGHEPSATGGTFDDWSRFVHPDDRPRVMAAFLALVEGQEDTLSTQYRYAHADGRWLDVLDRAHLIRNAEGRPVRMVGGMTDLTEIRRAHKRIENQVGRLTLLQRITRAIAERADLASIYQVLCDTLLAQMPAALVLVAESEPGPGAEAPVLRVRCLAQARDGLAAGVGVAQGQALSGTGEAVAEALSGLLVYDPTTGSRSSPLAGRLFAAGLRSAVLAPLQVEERIFGLLLVLRESDEGFDSPDCEFLRQLSEHAALAAHQAQLHAALQLAYDDLRRTQQAVLQQERLRALGAMASGIAHDINNAMSPVALYIDGLLQTEPALTAQGRERLQVVLRAIEDVARTVSRMREFHRPTRPGDLVQVNVAELFDQVLALTQARWSDIPQRSGHVIEIKRRVEADLPSMRALDGELREALTNLVFNAVDAMPGGGRLSLSAWCDRSRPGDETLVIEVRDDGAGMDEETRRRCLEPFFTTKGERGTGLGLAMVYGCVQRHGGEVEIESAPGAGTAVRLLLPFARADGRAEPALPEAPAWTRRLRLLVVDDDPHLLKSLADLLSDEGHEVTSAPGGREGVAIIEEARGTGGDYDVVITDLGMPYVDGRQVARAAKRASSTPVIMLTGWGRRMLDDGEPLADVDHVLAKPVRLQDLRRTLRMAVTP